MSRVLAARDSIKLSHPDRVVFPKKKLTKEDVFNYYASVAPRMFCYVDDRPLSTLRCPTNVDECFFQKHLPTKIKGTETFGKEKYFYISEPLGILSLVQWGCIEFHSWRSRKSHIELPDEFVLDLDPGEGVRWKTVSKCAFEIREALEELNITSFPKTTGGKGIHLIVPLKPEWDFDGVKDFTKTIAQGLESNLKNVLSNMSIEARKGKIFIDYLRNGKGATAVTSFSVRARPDALVAMPISWSELEEGAEPRDFDIVTAPKRVKVDPWKNYEKKRISIRSLLA